MECLTVKSKLQETFKEVNSFSKEQKNAAEIKQVAIDTLLDRILHIQSKIKEHTNKVKFINSKFQEFTWFKEMDDECLGLMKDILESSKEYLKALRTYYVKMGWAIRKGIARETMFELKHEIDDFAEYIVELHDIFFDLRQDEEFNEFTRKFEEL